MKLCCWKEGHGELYGFGGGHYCKACLDESKEKDATIAILRDNASRLGVKHEAMKCPRCGTWPKPLSDTDRRRACYCAFREYRDMEIERNVADRERDQAKAELSRRDSGYLITKDGDSWCATGPGFVNLAESSSGFGDTPLDALSMLFRQRKAAPEPGKKKVLQLWPPKPDEPEDGKGFCGADKANIRQSGCWCPTWTFLCYGCRPKDSDEQAGMVSQWRQVHLSAEVVTKPSGQSDPPDPSLEWRKENPCPHEAEVREHGCARGPEASCYCHVSPARYTPEELAKTKGNVT